MKKAYRGSCHCGAVKYRCEIDLAPAGKRSPPELPGGWWTSTFRCNCSSCWKTRIWKGFVRAKDFELLDGKDALVDYQFGERAVHHTFCKHCGIHPFANATLEVMGGDFYAVNLSTLDDATDEELANAPVTYEDGRHDAWDKAPAVTKIL